MQTQVHSIGFNRSDALDDHVREQVGHAVRHFEGRVMHVEAFLRDANGPKAGIDKFCTMEARINGQAAVAVEHRADDFYDAIRGAAAKLERAVQHRLDRHEANKSV